LRREDLRRKLSERLGVEVEAGRPLADYGVDSLEALELARELGIEPTELWSGPFLAPAAGGSPEPLAVVGIGCRFGGGLRGPAALWDLLCAGHDVLGPRPFGRADVGLARAGFLTEVDRFDAPFFNITAPEAQRMDPQQRLLLETAWEALDDAGLDPPAQTGVFVGLSAADYAQLAGGAVDAYSGTGGAASVAAGRLSYALGLHGPSLVVDTSSSSSLAALHTACQSLRAGECDVALVGGANLMLTPAATLYLRNLGTLSPQGRCRPFDAEADGYVRGEGCVVVVLKPLSAARRAGDPVRAVIVGSGTNHDGASNGLTAPNGAAQRALLRAVHGDAPVGYVEAHGTGTRLGDPIEAAALVEALGPVRVGSVKATLGHLEACAGLASLVKVVLALEHGQLPATPGFTVLNPLCPPGLQVVDRLTPWSGRAGVSSFGISGTNVHVALEPGGESTQAASARRGATEREATASPGLDGPHLLLLSAPDRAGLERQAARWGEYLLANPSLDLAAACANAAGRRPLRERLAVVAGSPAGRAAVARASFGAGGFRLPGTGLAVSGHGARPGRAGARVRSSLGAVRSSAGALPRAGGGAGRSAGAFRRGAAGFVRGGL